MKAICPYLSCAYGPRINSDSVQIIKNGSFYRTSDSKRVQKFVCKNCNGRFSTATCSLYWKKKKRNKLKKLLELRASSVTERRAAKILHLNRKSVKSMSEFLSGLYKQKNITQLQKRYSLEQCVALEFDDLETVERSKYLPLSVAIAVDSKSRKILDFQVNSMPARGLISKKAIQKYGRRQDERPLGWGQLMNNLKSYVSPTCVMSSDENPHYTKFVKKYHPEAQHIRFEGGRAGDHGQGELKKLSFDPIFTLNHTCAMLRANVSRLIRKTWSISKKKQGLIDHLNLYVYYHNWVLTEPAHAALSRSSPINWAS